jgi:predicted membrane channel-forming protein YqfA (hemolysin III family)
MEALVSEKRTIALVVAIALAALLLGAIGYAIGLSPRATTAAGTVGLAGSLVVLSRRADRRLRLVVYLAAGAVILLAVGRLLFGHM